MSSSTKYSTEAARWAAIRTRDPDADGHFVYTVKTTKIFCRPTCNARLARQANIGYAETAADAYAAGFRACKRCKPELNSYVPLADQSIKKVRQLLEDLPNDAPLPKLEVLAAKAGLTKYHFHRTFKKATGTTPREYALQRRQHRMSQTSPQPIASGESTISTPSLGYSVTPDTVKTPDLAFDDWLVAGPEDSSLFDDIELPFDFNDTIAVPESMDLTKDFNDMPMSFPIYFSLADASDGVLLMAFEESQVCKLELCATNFEAMMSLERSFPKRYYVLIPAEELQDDQRPIVQQKFRAVQEALENPFGRPSVAAADTDWPNGMPQKYGTQ